MEISRKKPENAKKSPESFKFGKVIGEGSFSTVYLAKEIENGKEYAIKVCDKDHIIKEKKTEYVKREKLALSALTNATGVIKLAYTFQDNKKLYFVLTFAANGEILKFINSSGFLSIEASKFYAAELLLAIEEMHRKNIIHRDLKPENLLLSRSMHLMIADFGSSKILADDYEYDIAQAEIEKARADEEREEEEAENSDESVGESKERQPTRRNSRRRPKRRASFVGTAQYVSPEILKGNAPHLSTDLWAFGCILYQMIAGAPPFRGPTEYLIFQKILSGEIEYPEDFNEDAADLIKKLLRFNPKDRLGSEDSTETRYQSIRNHKFFDGVNWNEIHNQAPPEMKTPRNLSESSEISDDIFLDIEPGLGQQREFEILKMNLNQFGKSPSSSSIEKLLDEQKKSKWSKFVEANELILKAGFIHKKKGLFARRRMFLLTNTPRLIYIDPNTNIKKGEIPFDSNLSCEARNFKIFFVHTPNRIYYLEDSNGGAGEWCEAIEKAKQKYIKLPDS